MNFARGGRPEALGFFLTFPQYNCTLEQAKILWVVITGHIEQTHPGHTGVKGGVCVEHHADGATHLHMLMKWTGSKLTFTRQNAKFIDDHITHGNY